MKMKRNSYALQKTQVECTSAQIFPISLKMEEIVQHFWKITSPERNALTGTIITPIANPVKVTRLTGRFHLII